MTCLGQMWLGPICGAAALAFAAVFTLAAVVAGFASALAFTVILAFTGVLRGVLCGIAKTRLRRLHSGRGLYGSLRLSSNRGSTNQARESSREKKSIQVAFHVVLTSLWVLGGGKTAGCHSATQPRRLGRTRWDALIECEHAGKVTWTGARVKMEFFAPAYLFNERERRRFGLATRATKSVRFKKLGVRYPESALHLAERPGQRSIG